MVKESEERILTLSFLMTALNEEQNLGGAIGDALQAIDDYGIEGEVVVINDGSTDGTGRVIEEFMRKDSRVKVITHETPKGVGGSFWDGVDVATGDVVCWLPGDNENDPWEILRYFGLMSQVDMVIPFVFNKSARSLFRNGLSFVYRFIINTTFLVNFNYTNGTVLYRKSILKELETRSMGFFFQTDILIRTVRRGYIFAEVPYRLGMRNTGQSKAVNFPSLMNVVRGYIKLVRDIYFSKEGKIPRELNAESSSARRYGMKKGPEGP